MFPVLAGAFQHALRHENPHDHLPRDGAAGLQHLLVDHRRLDCTSVREVSHDDAGVVVLIVLATEGADEEFHAT